MSVIYMISCRDETVPEIYIGSTSNFIRRRNEHFYSCNNINCKSHNFKLYRFIRSNGGIDNFVMEILERCYEDENKFEIEKKYIRLYNPELNSHKYLTEEQKEINKKIIKQEKKNKREQEKKERKKHLELMRKLSEIKFKELCGEKVEYKGELKKYQPIRD